MNITKFVHLKTALKLKEKGFDLGCDYIFINHYRVRDEIYQQYPGLSDDGYKDLTKEWGGHLKEEEVYSTYVEPIRNFGRNNPVFFKDMPYMVCTMPTLDDVRTWLRNHYKMHIVIVPDVDKFKATLMHPNEFGLVGCVGSSNSQVYNPEYYPSHVKATCFQTYESALEAAINETLVYIPNK